jgi:hypothetical protein
MVKTLALLHLVVYMLLVEVVEQVLLVQMEVLQVEDLVEQVLLLQQFLELLLNLFMVLQMEFMLVAEEE